jgi:hypothetical protein
VSGSTAPLTTTSPRQRGLDDDPRAIARRGVDREHHARALAVDHLLDDDRNRRLDGDTLDRTIGNDLRPEGRGPAVADARDERIGARDVREGLVHAGERRCPGVLARCRRTDRDLRIGSQSVVRDKDPVPSLRGHPGADYQGSQARSSGVERNRVVGIGGGCLVTDQRTDSASVHRVRIRVSRDDEA